MITLSEFLNTHPAIVHATYAALALTAGVIVGYSLRDWWRR